MWIVIALLTIMIGAIPVFRMIEKRDFNHGICRTCGEELIHFDNDSQGSEGWTCRNCGSVIWVGWINTEKGANK